MTIRLDPEENETRALFDLVDLGGRDVLEVGCGDGRLTWRYAERAAHVTAIDPFADAIERARASMPGTSRGRVDLHHIALADFAAARDSSTFDVAILSWSLC
jgi:2-polyprenyl-3-methyl-5-hydroxy-6-metoxy-1,4-benzoquinol methylase